MNLSTGFEVLVRDLHQALLRADGVHTVDVRHNVKIVGRSGATHQIDVYWEFQLAGLTYKTCIECKFFEAKVKKSHIAAFSAILEDIGGANGIFVTTVGYQLGALQFAQSKGIRLLLVNPLLKVLVIRSSYTAPSTDILSIRYDQDGARAALLNCGLESFQLKSCWNAATTFFDAGGRPTMTLKALFAGRCDTEGVFTLERPGIFDKTAIGLIEVEAIEYRVQIQRGQHEFEIPLNVTERAIVEDVLANRSAYLNDDGSVTQFVTVNDSADQGS